tara:strand:- start:1178 stop:1324 length:147 start_codon:yes stop_codon:yes gene_type:complete
MKEPTQADIDQMTAEEYSEFLAFGEVMPKDLSEDQYEKYLVSHQLFDL